MLRTMTVLLVVALAWVGLCALVLGLFLALVRGGGGTEAWAGPAGSQELEPVAVPGQRVTGDVPATTQDARV